WAAPAILTADLPNAQIEAVQDGGTIYRLWTNGSVGNEYFLVENRQPVGYDAALPGFGLLIWHIDEAMPHNEWEVLSHHNWLAPAQHYKVALEQADGLLNLERFQNGGDAGDPFPGTSNNRYFTFTTIPNSSSYYSSEDTLVAMANISDSAPTITAYLRVGVAPETGILVQVLNQDGEPARDANVFAYSDISAFPDAWGRTGEDGFAWLDVPNGSYTLVASSSRDHFLVVKEDVSSPSSVIMDTQGTVRVEFECLDLEGNALDAGIYLFLYQKSWGGKVGHTEAGRLLADVAPLTYKSVHAWSWSSLYYLFEPNVALSEDTIIEFHAAEMPTEQISIGLSDFTHMWFIPWLEDTPVAPVFEVEDKSRVVMSAAIYHVDGKLLKTDTEGKDWHYALELADSPITIASGTTANIEAGGNFIASTTPDKSQYSPGETVTISNLVTDGFGNRLEGVQTWGTKTGAASKPDHLAALAPQEHEGEISFSPGALQSAPSYEWQVIYPRLVVTDPDGNKVVDENSRDVWPDYSFNLPHDAPPGEYTVELSLDTGPHQGVITAHNSFQVTGVPGDVNADGRVDPADLTLVAVSFNRRADDQGFDPAADLNNDGIVDVFDLVRVGRNFGTGGN
ncbi:dockerin type I domain-containing protein, partial [Dehalococcoidia bacterium]|nr:dockerin type I domain-containing protein [Dehalococcoidia bacterium]